MNRITPALFGLVLLVFVMFGLSACSSGDSGTSDRLAALEAEVKALKLEAQVREKSFREELTQIRKNLEGIQDILKVDKGRADALVKPEADVDPLDEELDTKAKSFVNENLDRLLEITKKLLDKMEQELDEQMKKQETPETPEAPEGDEI